MPGPGMNSALSPDDVKTAIDAVVLTEYELQAQPAFADATMQSVFKQETIDRQAKIQDLFQGPGMWATTSEQGDAPSATSRIGNQKISQVLNFRKMVDISKNFFDDDQHNVVKDMMTAFGRTARLSRDQNAFNVYNLGFTTQTTADGVSLFSNSHVTLGGQTVDNLASGALTPTNLNLAMIQLQTMITQDGSLGGFVPKTLLVPPALFKTAIEVTDSVYLANTADNQINWISAKYGLTVVQNPYLGASFGGSDTQWFLLSDSHSIVRIVREGLQTAMRDWIYSDNFDYKYVGEFREVADSINFEGVVASLGV